MAGLFSGDGVCPGRFKSEFAGSFFGGLFGGGFNDGAQRIAQFAGVLTVGVIDAPQLLTGRWRHGCAHARS